MAAAYGRAEGLDPALGRMLDGQAKEIGRRLQIVETAIDDDMEELFPRLPDGTIDWERGPFLASGPGERRKNSAAMVRLGYLPCGFRCAFCSRSVQQPPPVPPTHFYLMSLLYKAAVDMGYGAGKDSSLVIGGHEPTRHPDLVSIIRLATGRGWRRIGLQTANAAFFDAKMVEAMKGAGLGSVDLPVYGVSGSVHDAVVGMPGHFRALGRAVKRFRSAGMGVMVHSVPLAINLEEIGSIPSWAAKRGAVFGGFMFPRNEGPSRIPVSEITPRLSDLPAHVRRALNLCIPCIGAGGDADASMARPPAPGVGGTDRPDEIFEHPARCRLCISRLRCSGVLKGYLAVHGGGEFMPVT
jgi:hypothetical protein